MSTPRVLILPGLAASSMGRRHVGIDDVVWLDTTAILEGRLRELAADDTGQPVAPLGLVPGVYVPLRARLELAGYAVDEYPFDWRRSLTELGPALAARLADEARETHLVAHSYGGLVALAALACGAPNVAKVVLLGAPVHGLFATVQGLRGRHWVLHALGALDMVHTAHELASDVFASWPSVYEMLPPPRSPTSVNLYEASAWPPDGPGPRHELLARAHLAQAVVASVRGDVHVIAGYGRRTVDGLDRTERGFVYHQSTDGDGWVPTSHASFPGVPTLYASASHLLLPANEDVIGAIIDLLTHSSTTRLVTTAPVPEVAPDDADDVDSPTVFGGRAGLAITRSDIQEALDQLLHNHVL